MGYVIVQILAFLIAAAAVGFGMGWLCRAAAVRSARDASATQARRRLGDAESQRDRLQAQLDAASKARQEAQDAAAQAHQAAEASAASLRRLEREHAATRIKLEARDRELARLSAELEGKRREIAGLLAPTERPPGSHAERTMPAMPEAVPEPAPEPGLPIAADEPATPPPRLPAPDGRPDDLRRISGIGAGIARTLNDLGIFHYRQIAELTPANRLWLDQQLRFKGRIEREDWIGQARRLLAGDPAEPAPEDAAAPDWPAPPSSFVRQK